MDGKRLGRIAAGHQQSAGTQHGQQLESSRFPGRRNTAPPCRRLPTISMAWRAKSVKIQMRHPIPGTAFAVVDLKKTRLH
jgi:hypothetical protein